MGAIELRSASTRPRAVAHVLNMPQVPAEPTTATCCVGSDEMTQTNQRHEPAPAAAYGRPEPPAGRRAPRPAFGSGCPRIQRSHRDPCLSTARGRGGGASSAVSAMCSSTSRPAFSRSRCRSRIWWTTGSRSATTAAAIRRMSTPWPTRTASCPRWARWICICSPRAATNDCGRSSARIRAASPRPTAWSTGCPSRCGRRMPRASA